MIRVLNLGAGVQSTTLLLMSCKGVLPKVDMAIFADTQWEPQRVYDHLGWLEGEASKHGIPVHRVTAGNIYADQLDTDSRSASIPLFVLGRGGAKGMIRRQCSSEYKVKPIQKFLRSEVMGLKPRQRSPKEQVIEQWFGISHDEAGRAKRSDDKWAKFQYPFLNWPDAMLPKLYRRSDCIRWLEENYPEIDCPKSACIGCPYHSNEEWQNIKAVPDEWEQALNLDRVVRESKKLDGTAYLHRSLMPLELVDLRSDDQKNGQQVFGWENECEGMCGV